MSEKQNIRDHKRRLLAAKYELRRKLYKFVKIPIDLVICGTNIVISCPSCQEIVPLHEQETDVFPRVALVPYIISNFSSRFSWISISGSFDGHKEIVLVASNQ
nr:ribosomal protein S14 [Dichrocephala benthamii]WLW15618.1 ribosomal protein S14 [Dichrocephala benthamii]